MPTEQILAFLKLRLGKSLIWQRSSATSESDFKLAKYLRVYIFENLCFYNALKI